MKLWEIDEAIRKCIDFETGEILDPEYLDHLEMVRAQKIENVALYVKELTYFEAELGEEIKRLQARKKAAENSIKGLKGWLVTSCNGNKFETTKVRVSFRRSTETVIEDESKVPKKYQTKKIVYTVSKTAIKDAIMRGLRVKGARLVDKLSAVIS